MKNVPITINVPDDVIADFLSHPLVITVLQRALTDAQRQQRTIDHEKPDMDTLDLSEAANLLGLAVSTTRDKAARREIPDVKTGKMWRFFRADLIKWLESNRRFTKIEIAHKLSYMFAHPKNAVKMITSECVFLCSCCGRKNKSLVLFYDYIFKLEAPHVDRLLEWKQAQLERLEAISLNLLFDSQYRAMQMLDEEIRTIAGAYMMLALRIANIHTL